MTNLTESKFTIVLTGFGPFGLFNNNPSEKVVRRIANEGIDDIQPNAKIIVKVMPVTYDDVQCIVSELWKEYHPDLVVHLGVHSTNHAVKIETRSCGIGYNQGDIKCNFSAVLLFAYWMINSFVISTVVHIIIPFFHNDQISAKTPEDYRCPLAMCSSDEEENIIYTGLNCTELVEAMRMEFARENIQFELSDDPGRYLCAYSYYISLRHDKNCSLFIHIPSFNKSCTLELLTKIVKQIIRLSVLQILKARKKNPESLCESMKNKMHVLAWGQLKYKAQHI
uniref:Pyroglutamyl-peptidase I n=1 Tax=Wuchereria bancrofti TaxID=6293 RepID=A0A1I8EXN3_WUCBA